MFQNQIKLSIKNDGFTLIEVLIALVVLAISLLGIASLQANGVRMNHSAYLRSQATALTYEIVDKMRSNRDRNSNFLNILDSYEIDFSDTISNPSDCYSNPCNQAQIVNYDLSQWKNSLLALPSGDGSIGITMNDDIVIAEISIRWDDTRGSENLEIFRTQTRL